VAELRAFVEIDAMQPQWAAYVAQTCQGDPPWAGMAELYVEVAPANEVFSLVNAAVKNADVRAGLQVVERQYGTLELHGRDPFAVRQAGHAILERLGLTARQETIDMRGVAMDVLARDEHRFTDAGFAVEKHAREGDPANVIAEVAEEQGSGMIVVGARGNAGGGSRFTLGNVASKLAHDVPHSLLIVRAG